MGSARLEGALKAVSSPPGLSTIRINTLRMRDVQRSADAQDGWRITINESSSIEDRPHFLPYTLWKFFLENQKVCSLILCL